MTDGIIHFDDSAPASLVIGDEHHGTVELNVDEFTPAEAADEFVKTVADVWRRLNGKLPTMPAADKHIALLMFRKTRHQ